MEPSCGGALGQAVLVLHHSGPWFIPEAIMVAETEFLITSRPEEEGDYRLRTGLDFM